MQRARFLFILATASAAVLAPVGSGAAQAVPPGDATVQVLAAAGSDTTQDVMTAVLQAYSTDRTENPDGDQAVNIPVRPNPGLTVPGDGTCEERTYVPAGQEDPPASYAAPSGSGAGKTALQDAANVTSGCIDIARSSSARGSTDPATFEYYGYAKDAVSWAHFPGAAPNELSLDALRGIYACTITNWNEVGGEDAPIIRYLPPAGSGTRSFFVGTVLGAEPATSCGELRAAAENDGSAVAAEDRPTAILPFSVAQWVAQANSVSADVRATAEVGGIDGQNPVNGPDATGLFQPDQAVINAGFIGVRTVYNVLDTRLPSYPQALRAVGFDATGPGYLCSGSAANTLTAYGLTPLPADDSGTTCTRS